MTLMEKRLLKSILTTLPRRQIKLAFAVKEGKMMFIMQKRLPHHLGVWLVLAGVVTGWATVRATTFLELQSTYLGDGWFQYQMSVLNDPFFTEADITGLQVNFSNEIDQQGGSDGWSNTGSDSAGSSWAFTNSIPARPYVETFAIRSSETSYRLGGITNAQGATVLLSLMLSECYPVAAGGSYSENILGFANLPCLVPCEPAEADGSPTNFVYDLKLLPDVQINQLIQNNGGIYGVDFTWDYAATFVLQGSADLNHWTNLAYLWSQPSETVWTTNQPLNAAGSFFRLEEVAGYVTTDLPPLNSLPAVSRAPKAVASTSQAVLPSVTNCRLANGKMVVSLTAQSGQPVQVQALNRQGTVLQSQTVTSSGSPTSVIFDPASLPNPAFFRAVVAP